MTKKKDYKQPKKYNGEGSLIEVEKNGKKYYRAYVTMGYDSEGNIIRKSFGGYKKPEVIKKMNKALYESDHNIYTVGDEITFGQFFKDWIYYYKKLEISKSTFEKYESAYRLKIKPYGIAKVKLKDLKTLQLQKYFSELISSKAISVQSAKPLHTKIKSCLDFAISQNVILRNPVNDVKLPKVKSKKSYSVFTKEEQEKILNELGDSSTDRLIKFAFATGLRLSELLGLTWEDIRGGSVYVQKQYVPIYTFKDDETKTRTYEYTSLKTENSNREIPLPLQIINMLDKHQKEQNKYIMSVRNVYKDTRVVFADSLGFPLERKRPGRRLNKICKELGIEPQTFHSTRHTYATRLFELDVPVKTVQELLGHSKAETTLDIYTHVMPEQKEEAVNKLNSLFL